MPNQVDYWHMRLGWEHLCGAPEWDSQLGDVMACGWAQMLEVMLEWNLVVPLGCVMWASARALLMVSQWSVEGSGKELGELWVVLSGHAKVLLWVKVTAGQLEQPLVVRLVFV